MERGMDGHAGSLAADREGAKLMDKRLANMMLGETVVYMNANREHNAAIIIDIKSDRVVSLHVMRPDGIPFIVRDVEYSNKDAGNTWWRRNKF